MAGPFMEMFDIFALSHLTFWDCTTLDDEFLSVVRVLLRSKSSSLEHLVVAAKALMDRGDMYHSLGNIFKSCNNLRSLHLAWPYLRPGGYGDDAPLEGPLSELLSLPHSLQLLSLHDPQIFWLADFRDNSRMDSLFNYEELDMPCRTFRHLQQLGIQITEHDTAGND